MTKRQASQAHATRPKPHAQRLHPRMRRRTPSRANARSLERTLTEPEEGVLRRGGIAADDFAPVRPGLRDAAALYEELLATSLTVDEVATRLRVDASRVRQRLAARSLYGVRVGPAWRLPRFQFRASGGVVPGLEKILARLPDDLSPVAVQRWLTTPNVDLTARDDDERPLTPLEWLQTGHSPEVAAELAAEL